MIAVWILTAVVLGLVAGLLIRNWSSVGRRLRKNAPTDDLYIDCMGFDISDEEKIINCKRIMRPEEVHILAEDDKTLPLDIEATENFSNGGTVVFREMCEIHCPGDCNKGCPQQNEVQV